ncbi:MAG TPA: regulatory iron-sulfur-containing complex subunit RicT, partial [Gemmatimonadales bacterium]
RRGFYDWAVTSAPLRLNEPVLVEAERGLDFGRVNAVGDTALAKCGGCTSCEVASGSELLATGEQPAASSDQPAANSQQPAATNDARPQVVRRAAPRDILQHEELRRNEDEVRRQVAERAQSHKLTMRISDTEWQWDRNRLTIYFTSESRVDFRNLVRELATRFRTRIELRQIGVRDEAARLGGVGRCGREFCCSTWLTTTGPVNLALAKDQRLSLNPAQISGGCGRLLCCLKYEHEFYLASRKRYPKEGKTVVTLRGAEKVIAVDIFRERVALRSDEHGSRIIAALDLRDEIDRAASSAPPASGVPRA